MRITVTNEYKKTNAKFNTSTYFSIYKNVNNVKNYVNLFGVSSN